MRRSSVISERSSFRQSYKAVRSASCKIKVFIIKIFFVYRCKGTTCLRLRHNFVVGQKRSGRPHARFFLSVIRLYIFSSGNHQKASNVPCSGKLPAETFDLFPAVGSSVHPSQEGCDHFPRIGIVVYIRISARRASPMAFVDQFAVNLRCATPQRGHKRCRVGGPQVVQTEPVQQEQRQNYPLRIVDNDCALSVFSVCEPGQVRVDLLAYTIENSARIGVLYPKWRLCLPL